LTFTGRLDKGERIWYNTFNNNTSLLKGQNMRHEETRDNTTAIETQSIDADAHADTREWSSEPDPAGVQLETDPVKVAERHDEIVAKARQESEERFEEINDGPNGYDDEPEDDGQPSEYEEWQDYFGGDDYYDHSENEIW
jgi:hypothetical protein